MVAALVLCVGLTGRADGGAAVNPHWDSQRCGECHRVVEGKPAAVAVGEVDQICLRCHDGRGASAEAHPVGRVAAKERAVPAGWPLDEGRLVCVTCHDVRKACVVDGARTNTTARLLRGTRGTGTFGRESFCDNCHAPAEHPRFNPHLMLTPQREVIDARCLVCHTEVPARSTKERTGRAMLRGAGEQAVCRSCHARHKDQFNPGHLGAKVKPEMQAFIRAREVVGLASPPGPELVAQIKAAGAKPTLMPLTADATITCSTCHNPHQAGVFRPGTPLAYRPMRVAGERAVSPVRGDQWCNHCHDL